MRIMHISTRLILGGSQENTVLSCEGQADDGHAVSLVYGPIFGPEGSMLDRVRADGRIEPIETPRLVREVAPLKDLRCLRDLARIIKQWKPDVVHTHSSKAGILGRMAAWKCGVPCVVHTIHGLAFHPYQSKRKNAMYISAERHAAKRCHKIICVADAMRDQALAAGVGKRDQYVTVYSGMEVETFLTPQRPRTEMRAELGIADDAIVLGTVARLAELKGHDDLLDALGPMLQDDPRLMLLWVGDGWWRDRLMQRVNDLGLAERVITPGLVPPETIPNYMHAMDVLIHPSYREGLPRTVTQGLLSGRGVVAYDVDGTREVCIDGTTGRLVAPGDLAELAAACRWMIDHPQQRVALGAAGQAMCKERFAARKMVDDLQKVYNDVLDSR